MIRITIFSILFLVTMSSLVENSSCAEVPPPPPPHSKGSNGFDEVPKGDPQNDEVDVGSRTVSKAIKYNSVPNKKETTSEMFLIGDDGEAEHRSHPDGYKKSSLITSNRISWKVFYGWSITRTNCWIAPGVVSYAEFRATTGYYCGGGRVYYHGRRICVKPGCRAYIYYY